MPIWMPEIFEPQPLQKKLILACDVVDEIAAVGGRGSGKTSGILWAIVSKGMEIGHGWDALIIRKDLDELLSIRREIAGWIRKGLPAVHKGAYNTGGMCFGKS